VRTILSTTLLRYVPSIFRYGGIFESQSREYTLDDFYALQLDKMERCICLKRSEVVIGVDDQSSSDGEDMDDGDEDEDEGEGDEMADQTDEEGENPALAEAEYDKVLLPTIYILMTNLRHIGRTSQVGDRIYGCFER
jgi:hypothetical protein